jgi:carbamoyltransferase
MITWGISANSHDAALAVFVDKKLEFASHSERFSKKKNDRDLCPELVKHAKSWGNPDKIYWYERPFVKTLRQFYAGQGWKLQDNNIKKYLARYEINAPIVYVDHHRSHAAAGYYTSPFENACIIVIDAIGEFTTYSVWSGVGKELHCIEKFTFPNSLGLWYSAMTQRVGLTPNEDEYILMGMAAYGDPSKLTKAILDDFVSLPNDDYQHPYRIKQNLHRGCLDWRPDLTVSDSFDLAAATQAVYEMAFERILYQASRSVDLTNNLVLMGGCALNCSANRLTGKYFKNTWIYPNPGDAGSAIGAVLAKNPGWRYFNDWSNPFLGYDIKGNTSNEEIVEYIIQNKICGLARGKSEFGPRALGNRSLLADPRGEDIKDTVNAIKQRQQFRPFAPAILEEHVDMYFDMPPGWTTSRYMQVIARCRHPQLYPAIIHRDGTSRVQTVPNDGSLFRKLLEEWYDRTGCPMLLNTSLNIKGKPMVNDHTDAMNFHHQYGVKVFN